MVAESDTQHSELFRALRRSSNNFGIVTRFTFRIFPQDRMWGGVSIHGLESKDEQLKALYDFCVNPAYDENASLITSFGMSAARGSGVANTLTYTMAGSEPRAFKPFIDAQPLYMNTFRELTLTELTKEQDAFNENGLW